MDPLVISQIFATPDIPISRNLPDEAVLIPGMGTQVWESTKPGDSSDTTAPDGSLTPFGFLLDPKNKGVAHIRLTGTATYPQQWQGVLKPVLVGYLDDSRKTPVISASIGEVVLPAGRTAPVGPLAFTIAQMDFAEPLDPSLGPQSPVPYRVAGDFRWMLTCPENFTPITTTVKSRLEFYWLKSYAPSGPLKVHTSASETMSDMQGKYPVSVLRYFLPSFTELNITGIDISTHPSLWWVRYVITNKITGVKYNAIDGRAGYGVGCCGGSFNWRDWTSKVNPYVNSFDLAALVQAAMGLFSTRNFFDYDFPLHWVCHTPDGFLQPSMPFGWATTDPQTSKGANNPFFLGLTSSSAVTLPSPSTVPNCELNARAWLEIGPSNELDGQFVIDTAFNLPAKDGKTYPPEIGDLTRTLFLKAHLSTPDGGSANATDNGVPDKHAACYSNETFGGTQSGEPGTITRVGLTNLFGANEPKFGPSPMPLMPMPAAIRNAIAAAVTARRVAGARWMYNDASLKGNNVFPILTNTTAFTAGNSGASVAKGVSVVTYLLGNVGLAGATSIGQICVKIHVYDTFHDSTEALALELSKFESKLAAVLHRTVTSTVGNYYVATHSSVLFVRGNLLVDITFIGTVSVDDGHYAAGVLMASRLDAYLSARQVMKTQVRRPSLALATPTTPELNGEVVVGGHFDVTMANPELLADECVARSDIGRVLLCTTGPVAGQVDRKFSFLAMSLDLPKVGQKTEVTIVGAHPDTYHPGYRSFTVTVKPK